MLTSAPPAAECKLRKYICTRQLAFIGGGLPFGLFALRESPLVRARARENTPRLSPRFQRTKRPVVRAFGSDRSARCKGEHD